MNSARPWVIEKMNRGGWGGGGKGKEWEGERKGDDKWEYVVDEYSLKERGEGSEGQVLVF